MKLLFSLIAIFFAISYSANAEYNTDLIKVSSNKIKTDSSNLKIDRTRKEKEDKFIKFWDNLDWLGGDLNRVWVENEFNYGKNVAFNAFSETSEVRPQTLWLAERGLKIKDVEELFTDPNSAQKFQSLNLRSAGLTIEDITRLGKIVPYMVKVTDLYVGKNTLQGEGIKRLTNLVLTGLANKIEILDLESTNLGTEGIKELIRILPRMPRLRVLFLGNNNIGDSGAKNISRVIADLKHLQIISLKSNNIGVEGIKELMRIIPHLDELHIVDLKNNQFGDAGIEELIEMFPHFQQMRFLDLEGNKVSKAVSEKFLKAVQTLPRIRQFWI